MSESETDPKADEMDNSYQLPESSVEMFDREYSGGYLFSHPDEDFHRVMITHPAELGEKLAGGMPEDYPELIQIGHHLDYGVYQIFALSDVGIVRERFECLRDEIRYKKSQSPSSIVDPDLDALQEFIDALVITEQAVKHIQSTGEDERVCHYRRVDVLCDDPETAINAVARTLGGQKSEQSTGLTDGLKGLTSRLSNGRSDQ